MLKYRQQQRNPCFPGCGWAGCADVVGYGGGAFKCFGCGRSGNIFKFEQLMHGDSYQEALRKLGARAGVAPGPKTLSDKVERYHLYLLENRDNSLTTIQR